MRKKSNIICIPLKKGIIVGLILSLIYAVLISYSVAYTYLNVELDISKIKIFDFTVWLIPLFFIVFGTYILLFTTIFSGKNKK